MQKLLLGLIFAVIQKMINDFEKQKKCAAKPLELCSELFGLVSFAKIFIFFIM